ncbi:MAG: hypothetical protein ABJD11_00040 [Gemmatimonadota bacterium]
MEIFGRIFAAIGAGAVLAALTFVSLLIGVIVNGMIILMSGGPIDEILRKRGETVHTPGQIK